MPDTSKRIYIFDTTLRDGEQSPGVSLNVEEKLKIAHQLARLGVDVIEAGFPIASPGDFEAVRAIAREVEGPVIAGLARINDRDIDRAWEALQEARRPRIHVFIATSDIHLKYKLRMTREEVLAAVRKGVARAKSYCQDVEFSPEDASRSDIDFLCQVLAAAIESGATVLNIPDTVGYATPAEFGHLIAEIRRRVPGIEKVQISVHCHNDLGLAVANSLAAIENGALQVEGAINGIGERAGNTALEELVMALYTRRDYYGCHTAIVTEEIYRTSKLVSSLTGMPVQYNKAIVGKNAFAHEAGIHQDGVLKERTTYEIMNPTMIGVVQSNIVLGKHSGRHALRSRLEELGFKLNEAELDKAFARFKELADRKKEISDRDLEAIVEHEVKQIPEKFALEHIHISTGNRVVPTATIGLRVGEELKEEAACGEGPVDAAFKAIDKITRIPVCLKSYTLNAVTGGKDAVGEVTVKVEYAGRVFIGRGISTDVLEASARAYVNAINKVVYEIGEENLQVLEA
ncbi:2-isopropylmalate synthase, bacterial-type [Moorella glycerini]|uniref:2-isopropylmalate synthase n=1 Tax=Neomoorella stamsii TaxID=1266720 RepID=A0A9X7J4Q2_9FIRM|nr:MULTISPECIES: 2-isopropylmalate synthase [Moorella]PRR73543.1 2-isopropylmalate synthase [Moorella stamsii]CEP69312.1 2-isopropylmalate synthase, bacterial-type [Moorella glycerini]